jgi:hypothetical protein
MERNNRFFSGGNGCFLAVAVMVAVAVFLAGGPRAGAQTWTDGDLVTLQRAVKPIHIRELRRAIYNKRMLCGMSAPVWENPNIISKVTPIRAQHVEELRQTLKDIYDLPPARPLPEGVVLETDIPADAAIQASHIYELRTSLEVVSCCGDGECNPPYEELANCPVDCGACTYSDWVIMGCGVSPCEPNEIMRTKTAPEEGCLDLIECVTAYDSCCNYGPWEDYTCGGGECDPTAMQQIQRSATGVEDCPERFQCAELKSCCDYAGLVWQCGYDILYPDTQWLEVNIPANPACDPEFGTIYTADDPVSKANCCDYGMQTSSCGGEVEGVVYPDSTLITYRSAGNSNCAADITITPNADDCCDYGGIEVPPSCGATLKVDGEMVTFPNTTFLQFRTPANTNCDHKIVQQIDIEDDPTKYCCSYSGFTGNCGYGSYPDTDWIEYNVPGVVDLACPTEYRNHIENADSCCCFASTSACGDGVTYPTSSMVISNAPTCNPSCPTQVTEDPFNEACCGYGPWQYDQCGYPGYYDDTYLVDFREPTNPVCSPIFGDVFGPNKDECCNYPDPSVQCGGTWDGVDYPETTCIYGASKPANPNCPDCFGGVEEMCDYCCDYEVTSAHCGDGVTYPVTTLFETLTPANPSCDVLVDQATPDGCCGYGGFTRVCGYDGRPLTTSVQVMTPTQNFAECPTVVQNEIANDPFCCGYGGFQAPQCGYSGWYPGHTLLEVNEPSNAYPGCDPLFQNVVPNEYTCCAYGSATSACGDGVTYPTSSWVTTQISATGCDPIVTEQANHQSCCDYPASPTTECGALSYPITYLVSYFESPTNPTCAVQIVGVPAFDEVCCQYGSLQQSCGDGVMFPVTDYVSWQEPGIVHASCPIKVISQIHNDNTCCGYPPTYTLMCGYAPLVYPETPRVEIKEPTLTECPVRSRNPYPYHDTCCEYTTNYYCGYGAPLNVPATHYVAVKEPGGGKSCPVVKVSQTNYAEICCGYTTGTTEDLGCGASYDGLTCNYDRRLIVTTPVNTNCPVQKTCTYAASCTTCSAGETLACPPVNGCPYQRVCVGGVWSACQQANPVCTPGEVVNCEPNPDGFISRKTCNICGTGWGPCWCDPQETQICTTSSSCPGIGTCSGGGWTACEQSNPTCGPGSTRDCTLGDGNPGVEECVSCGNAYEACRCLPGVVYCYIDGVLGTQSCNTSTGLYGTCVCISGSTKTCTAATGCTSGVVYCNNATGAFDGACELPYSDCTPGATRSCLKYFIIPGTESCTDCGNWSGICL